MYSLFDKLPVQNQSRVQREIIRLVFSTLLEPVTEALSVVRTRSLQVKATELNENGNVVMSSDLQQTLSVRYRNFSLLFFANGWAEPKLGTKRSKSEKNGGMYAQTTMKKRKTGGPG